MDQTAASQDEDGSATDNLQVTSREQTTFMSGVMRQNTGQMKDESTPTTMHHLSITIDDHAYGCWQQIASNQKLRTDAEIVYFLLQHYEKTWPASICISCHNPLTLHCTSCNAPAQQTKQSIAAGSSHDQVIVQQIRNDTECRLPQLDSREEDGSGGDGEMAGDADDRDDAHADISVGLGTNKREVTALRRSSRNRTNTKRLTTMTDDIEKVLAKLASGQETLADTEGSLEESDEYKSYTRLIDKLETLSDSKADATDPDFEMNDTGRTKPSQPKSQTVMASRSKSASAKTRQVKMRARRAKTGLVKPNTMKRRYTKDKKSRTKERRFICEKCNSAFFGSNDLRRHMRTHTGEKPYVCEKCGAAFALASTLKRHNLCHTGDKPFGCSECGSCFYNASYLAKHMRLHTGERPYLCEECGAAFIQPGNLQNHIKKNHVGEKPFVCEVCCAAFKTANHLSIHARIHTGENPYQCTECGAGFPSYIQMKEHKRTHIGRREYKCKESGCDGVFKTAKLLALHMQTHGINTSQQQEENSLGFVGPNQKLVGKTLQENDKEFFGCNMCSADLSTLDEWRLHLESHGNKKWHLCKTCGSAFKTATKLKEHIRTHTGEKPFVCKECSAAFSNMTNLKAHTRTHTGFKPYICEVCDASFTISSNLKTHMRIHTGERPYACQQCSLTFTQAASLRRHMRTHTGDRPYVCDKCGACFMAPANLKRHLKTHSHAGEKALACKKCGVTFTVPANMHTGKGDKAWTLCASCAAGVAIVSAVESAMGASVSMETTVNTTAVMGNAVETAVAVGNAMENANAMGNSIHDTAVDGSQMQVIKITLDTLYNSQGP